MIPGKPDGKASGKRTAKGKKKKKKKQSQQLLDVDVLDVSMDNFQCDPHLALFTNKH